MLHNLYLIVAVSLRVLGLSIALTGLTMGVIMLPITHDPISVGLTALAPSLLGFVFWFVSKPVARAVTNNL